MYPDAAKVRYDWTCCRLSRMVDATGVSMFTYDLANRLVGAVDANKQMVSYQYNANGQPIRVLLPDGHSVERTYSPLGKVAEVTDPDAAVSTFTYLVGGQMSEMNFPGTGAIGLTWDGTLGLITAATVTGGDTADQYAPVDTAYPTASPLNVTGPINGTQDYFDTLTVRADMRVLTEIHHNTELHETFFQKDYGYDKTGNLTQQTDVLLTTVMAEYYNRANFLTGFKTVNDPPSPGQLSLNPHNVLTDRNGNIKQIVKELGLAHTFTWDFTFDAENRLLQARGIDQQDAVASTEIGALTSYTYTGGGGGLVTLTLTSGSFPTGYTQGTPVVLRCGAGGCTQFLPDGLVEGANVLGLDTCFDSCSATGLELWTVPITAATEITILEFAYDGLGRRVITRENGTGHWYVYDGGQLVQDRGERSDELLVEYTYGPTPVGPIAIFKQNRGGQERFFYTSPQGGFPRYAFDEAGTLTDWLQYSASGELVFHEASGTPSAITVGANGGWLMAQPSPIPIHALELSFLLPSMSVEVTHDVLYFRFGSSTALVVGLEDPVPGPVIPPKNPYWPRRRRRPSIGTRIWRRSQGSFFPPAQGCELTPLPAFIACLSFYWCCAYQGSAASGSPCIPIEGKCVGFQQAYQISLCGVASSDFPFTDRPCSHAATPRGSSMCTMKCDTNSFSTCGARGGGFGGNFEVICHWDPLRQAPNDGATCYEGYLDIC